jgi:hypothetical protein
MNLNNPPSVVKNANVLFNNTKLEAKIAKNNASNELYTELIEKHWPVGMPPAIKLTSLSRSTDLTINIDAKELSVEQLSKSIKSITGLVNIINGKGLSEYLTVWEQEVATKLIERYIDMEESDFLQKPFILNLDPPLLDDEYRVNLSAYSLHKGKKINWKIAVSDQVKLEIIKNANKSHTSHFNQGSAKYM